MPYGISSLAQGQFWRLLPHIIGVPSAPSNVGGYSSRTLQQLKYTHNKTKHNKIIGACHGTHGKHVLTCYSWAS